MIIALAISIITICGPLIAVPLSSTSGLGICIISFFLINPILSVGLGVFAGFDMKKRWYAALYSGVIFTVGAWIILAFDVAFLYYSTIYLIFSVLTMLVTHLIIKIKK